MKPLIVEMLAFIISIVGFIYGVFKVSKLNSPLYFKLIVNAVGCYALEELWAIINALCGFENGFISIRLIGIFGCYCTLLTANVNGLSKLADKRVNIISLLAPLICIGTYLVYIITNFRLTSITDNIISLTVILPLIIDSYFEIRNLLIKSNKYIKCIRLISLLIIIEYMISLSYFFIQVTSIRLILDIASALVMTLLVIECEKGVIKWETVI